MNKQIEEMAKTMHDGCAIVKGTNQCRGEDCLDCAAVTLHEAGYRRQDEVAREIFADVLGCLRYTQFMNDISKKGTIAYIAKLKKKYGVTEDES